MLCVLALGILVCFALVWRLHLWNFIFWRTWQLHSRQVPILNIWFLINHHFGSLAIIVCQQFTWHVKRSTHFHLITIWLTLAESTIFGQAFTMYSHSCCATQMAQISNLNAKLSFPFKRKKNTQCFLNGFRTYEFPNVCFPFFLSIKMWKQILKSVDK